MDQSKKIQGNDQSLKGGIKKSSRRELGLGGERRKRTAEELQAGKK